MSFFLLTGLSLQAQPGFHIGKIFHIRSAGGWDYIAVGPGNNRLYVSHGTRVNILDKSTGDSLGVIENTTGVHGISFDVALNKGFTSNGRLNTVTVFNLTDNSVIAEIPTGANPDAIMFEPYSKMIITCNGRSNDLSLIDPARNAVVATVPVGGKPETAVSDGAGRIYVNIENKSEIAVVDLKNRKVEARWPLAPAEEPTGLAIDTAAGRLFAGCGNKLLAVLDLHSGRLIETLPIGAGCDGVAFDGELKNIYTSNGEGTLSVYREKSPDEFVKLATVVTKRGARTLIVDPRTHWIYLPTADFETPASSSGGRPGMIPGTFQVLVVEQ